MLTAEGMRERYLLGRYNRERYVEKFKFLSPQYNPSEIYIQSTNVNRTLQSAYSELLGLYPPDPNYGGERLTSKQSKRLNMEGFGLPPFVVRDHV